MKNLTLFLLALSLNLASFTWAEPVPPNPNPIEVTQPDGSKLTVYFSGGPHYSWYTDAQGYSLVRDDDDKAYYYAIRNVHGDLVPLAAGFKSCQAGKLDPSRVVEKNLRPSEEAMERAKAGTPRTEKAKEVRGGYYFGFWDESGELIPVYEALVGEVKPEDLGLLGTPVRPQPK